MESTSIILLVAAGCAAVAGILLASAAIQGVCGWHKTTQVLHASGTAVTPVSRLLVSGVGPLRPVVRVLLNVQVVRTYAQQVVYAIQAQGRYATCEGVISALVVVGVPIVVLAGCISGSAVCACAIAAVLLLGLAMGTSRINEQQRTNLREGIPEALQSMKSCFQVGYSLAQTISEVHKSTTGALSKLFGEVEAELEMGGGVDKACEVLKRRGGETELVFLAAALEIQHKTGSSMLSVLEVTRQSVADEVELKRTLRTQTAQAKLSAQIVTIMPFALIGLFSLVSPGFLDPFFSSIAGFALLGVALVMQLTGIALVRRLLKIEVD